MPEDGLNTSFTITNRGNAPVTVTLPSLPTEEGAICKEFSIVHRHLSAITGRIINLQDQLVDIRALLRGEI